MMTLKVSIMASAPSFAAYLGGGCPDQQSVDAAARR